MTVEQKQEGRSRTRTAVSGSPGVLTLTETLWPKSGPRQTLVALTFTPGQAVMSKSIYRFPVSGLLLSKIDCREGTFHRKKESWANRGHVSFLEIFISFKQMPRFLNLRQIDFAKRQWHQYFWHHFFMICSGKYIKKHPSRAQFNAAGSESGVSLRKGWFHSLLWRGMKESELELLASDLIIKK